MIPDIKTIVIVGAATMAVLAFYRLQTGTLYGN